MVSWNLDIIKGLLVCYFSDVSVLIFGAIETPYPEIPYSTLRIKLDGEIKVETSMETATFILGISNNRAAIAMITAITNVCGKLSKE